MSYSYPPPPPPPQPGPQSYGQQTPSYGQPAHRGGGSQGRGGGRGGTYAGGGSYGGGRPEYQQTTQSPYPYSGYSPSTPASYGSESGYQASWHPEHGQAPPPQHAHSAAQHTQHGGHAPTPISSSNYHPNYAQSGYAQQPQPQYSHAGYGPPSQPQYGSPYGSGPPPVSPQWSGQASPPQQSYNSARPHRGGYQSDHRGGSRGAATGHSERLPYRPEPPPAQVQVNGSYAGQYQEPRPPAQYPPPTAQAYQYAPPPPPPAQTVAPPRQDQFYGHNNRRGGRGGFRDGGRGGRPQFQNRNDKSGPKKHSHHPNQENNHKPDQSATGKKKKRKVNTLGLTPGNASETEEEDESEEQRLSKLMGNELLEITDLDAFLADRKRKYPTKARVEAKQAAEVAAQTGKVEETARLERERERLKRRLEKVESSIKRKREQQDEGDEMRDSADEDESDDDKPEVQSSRPPTAAASGNANTSANPVPAPPPPPARKADVTKHCKYYSTGGSCGKKGKCRFVHDPAVREAAIREKEANNGQLTIKQRLILNDKEQEDLSILESIEYIRVKGLVKTDTGLGQASAPSRPAEAQAAAPAPKSGPGGPVKIGSLPAKPPTLPPTPPVKRESGMPKNSSQDRLYNGWNLLGYGGTGIKPEDLP